MVRTRSSCAVAESDVITGDQEEVQVSSSLASLPVQVPVPVPERSASVSVSINNSNNRMNAIEFEFENNIPSLPPRSQSSRRRNSRRFSSIPLSSSSTCNNSRNGDSISGNSNGNGNSSSYSTRGLLPYNPSTGIVSTSMNNIMNSGKITAISNNNDSNNGHGNEEEEENKQMKMKKRRKTMSEIHDLLSIPDPPIHHHLHHHHQADTGIDQNSSTNGTTKADSKNTKHEKNIEADIGPEIIATATTTNSTSNNNNNNSNNCSNTTKSDIENNQQHSSSSTIMATELILEKSRKNRRRSRRLSSSSSSINNNNTDNSNVNGSDNSNSNKVQRSTSFVFSSLSKNNDNANVHTTTTNNDIDYHHSMAASTPATASTITTVAINDTNEDTEDSRMDCDESAIFEQGDVDMNTTTSTSHYTWIDPIKPEHRTICFDDDDDDDDYVDNDYHDKGEKTTDDHDDDHNKNTKKQIHTRRPRQSMILPSDEIDHDHDNVNYNNNNNNNDDDDHNGDFNNENNGDAINHIIVDSSSRKRQKRGRASMLLPMDASIGRGQQEQEQRQHEENQQQSNSNRTNATIKKSTSSSTTRKRTDTTMIIPKFNRRNIDQKKLAKVKEAIRTYCSLQVSNGVGGSGEEKEVKHDTYTASKKLEAAQLVEELSTYPLLNSMDKAWLDHDKLPCVFTSYNGATNTIATNPSTTSKINTTKEEEYDIEEEKHRLENDVRRKIVTRISTLLPIMEQRKKQDQESMENDTGCRVEKRKGRFKYIEMKSNEKVTPQEYEKRYLAALQQRRIEPDQEEDRLAKEENEMKKEEEKLARKGTIEVETSINATTNTNNVAAESHSPSSTSDESLPPHDKEGNKFMTEKPKNQNEEQTEGITSSESDRNNDSSSGLKFAHIPSRDEISNDPEIAAIQKELFHAFDDALRVYSDKYFAILEQRKRINNNVYDEAH